MTDIEARLRRDLPQVADRLLAGDEHVFRVPDPSGDNRGLRRSIALLVTAIGLAVFGGLVIGQRADNRTEIVQMTAQGGRVAGLDSEVMQLMSDAMAPTIPAGSPVLLYELTDSVVLERGDLVVVPGPEGRNFELIRRIVGLPGEYGGQYPPLLIDDEWILQPWGQNGDESTVTGASDEEARSSRINFGYVVVADNEQWANDSSNFVRIAHDDIRLWAPGDTTAVPPLLDSERKAQVAGLTSCLDETGLNVSNIRLSSTEVFGDVSREMNSQNVDRATADAIFSCVQQFSLLSR